MSDWIEHTTGQMPVDSMTKVFVMLREDNTGYFERHLSFAKDRDWDLLNDGSDIIAYKIVKD